MDRWILSLTLSLQHYVYKELNEYRLYTVVPGLVKFIEHLVNWYIRMNRRRLKGECVEVGDGNGVEVGVEEDWFSALHTLTKVMMQLIFMMAPVVPFFTEFLYQHLKSKLDFSNFDLGERPGVLYLIEQIEWATTDPSVVLDGFERVGLTQIYLTSSFLKKNL